MNEYSYDSTYEPAVPVCEFVLHNVSTDQSVTLTGIVDTGADATIVPVRYLQEIHARRIFEAGLRSQWGERRTIFLYIVDIQLNSLTLPGIYVVGDDLGDEVILGRDVLNHLRLLLDGPAQIAQLLENSSGI